MDYFIPAHIKGRTEAGVPYEFFRGIHAVPDALADSHEANTLGIVPVEEMSDNDWKLMGLNKDAWMEANRSTVDAPAAEPAATPADPAPVVAAPAAPVAKPVAAVSPAPAVSAPASTDKAS